MKNLNFYFKVIIYYIFLENISKNEFNLNLIIFINIINNKVK